MNRILNGDGYEKCDVSLLYSLIRYTCQINPPTVTPRRELTWGGFRIPSRECTELGDELERMRIIRNRIFGHIHNTEVEDNDFQKYFGISLGICQRLNWKFGTKDYVKELKTIETCQMEPNSLAPLTEKVKENIEMNEELRDFVRVQTGKYISLSTHTYLHTHTHTQMKRINVKKISHFRQNDCRNERTAPRNKRT